MPKHATRVKGVPGAFVREIRPINCDQPRLDQGPRHAVLGPGAWDRGHRTRDQGPGTRDLARRARDRGPGIADQAPGIGQADQGSRTRARGTRYVYKGSRAAQGGQDRRGFTWERLPGEKKPGAAAGFLAPGWRLGVDVSGLVPHWDQVIQARPVGVVLGE